ncbi:MAG TPA: hypothetical protein VF624_14320, partial [Tepidisphaeraceae bacterium]
DDETWSSDHAPTRDALRSLSRLITVSSSDGEPDSALVEQLRRRLPSLVVERAEPLAADDGESIVY